MRLGLRGGYRYRVRSVAGDGYRGTGLEWIEFGDFTALLHLAIEGFYRRHP